MNHINVTANGNISRWTPEEAWQLIEEAAKGNELWGDNSRDRTAVVESSKSPEVKRLENKIRELERQ